MQALSRNMASEFFNWVEFSSICRYFTRQKYAVGYQSRVLFADWRDGAMVKVWCMHLFMQNTKFKFQHPIRWLTTIQFQVSNILWPPGHCIHVVNSHACTQNIHIQNNKTKSNLKRESLVWPFESFALFSAPQACETQCSDTKKSKPLWGAPGIHKKIAISRTIQAFSSKKPAMINRMSFYPMGS